MNLYVKIFKSVILTSIIFSLSGVVFSQAKKVSSWTCPEMTGEILNRKVCEPNFDWEKSDIITALMTSFSTTKTPAGVSQISGKSEESELFYDLTPSSLALSDVLTKTVSIDPRYQWKEENGVINVFPVNDYPIFSEIVSEFKFVNKTKGDLLQELLNTEAFERYRKFNKIRSFPLEICCGLSSPRPPRRFSIDLKNSTVREILNEIVRLNGSSTWIYKEFESTFPEGESKRYYDLYFLVETY